MCIAECVYNMNFRPTKVMDSWLFGNRFIDKVLKGRLKLPENEQVVWKQYIRHIAKQSVCSEKGFYTLFSWPLQPARSIEEILKKLRPKIAIDFMYGDEDWMKPAGAHRLAQEFKNMKVHKVSNAGHQMLFDNPAGVSEKIIEVFKAWM